MLNTTVIMGRLTADPELKVVGSGVEVCSFTIANDDDYKAKDSDERKTIFVDVTCWRKTAAFVSKYFSKGRMIIVSGKLNQKKWTDKDGKNRSKISIVAENVYFGDSKGSNSSESSQSGPFTELPDADESSLPF